MLTDWTASLTDYEVTGILQGAGVAAFPSISAPEIFSDAHLADRGFMRPMTHPDFGERHIMGPPWQLSGTPAVIARHSPLIGEHNDHVFGNMLGISAAEIARLKDEEVIA